MTEQEYLALIQGGQLPVQQEPSFVRQRRGSPYVKLAAKVVQKMFRERLALLEISQWRANRHRPIRLAGVTPCFAKKTPWLINSAGPVWDNAIRAYEEER